MLVGQDGGGDQDGGLLESGGATEGGAHRDLGLAEAHISDHEPLHRMRGLHVGQDFPDGAGLVRGLFVGKLRPELPLHGVSRREGEARA